MRQKFHGAEGIVSGPFPVSGARLVFGLCLVLGLLAGCATRPPALPAVVPSELPGAWLEPLSKLPCPDPFRARLRIRIEAEGAPGFTADGSLVADAPRSLRLQARIGAFRPLFALIARADSCELLLHDESRYWVVPASPADWDRMDPAAWTQALYWALCPAGLYSELETDGPGKVSRTGWELEGRLRGTPHRFRLRLDPDRSALKELRILGPAGEERLTAILGRPQKLKDAWLPRTLDLSFPSGGLRLKVEVNGLRVVSQEEAGQGDLIYPAGWEEIGPEGLQPGLGRP